MLGVPLSNDATSEPAQAGLAPLAAASAARHRERRHPLRRTPACKSELTAHGRYAILRNVFGDVAQLVERDNRTVEVRSSSLLVSTSYIWGVSSVGRAQHWQC